MDNRKVEIERFNQVVNLLQQRFPSLSIQVQLEHPHLHANLDIVKQPGLDFNININLQNRDELHLSASEFWGEWFPWGDQAVFDEFCDAALGVITGEYRIVERYVFGRYCTGALQKPVARQGWKTIYSHSNLNAIIPWRSTERIVQNLSARSL
jgi:hypothetical protein